MYRPRSGQGESASPPISEPSSRKIVHAHQHELPFKIQKAKEKNQSFVWDTKVSKLVRTAKSIPTAARSRVSEREYRRYQCKDG